MTTHASIPDWLALRGGAIQRGICPETRFVMIGGEPLYKLEVRPAQGRFACAVMKSVNGQRLDAVSATYPSFDEALAGGLEELRAQLGW
jgi:hypothetical protein